MNSKVNEIQINLRNRIEIAYYVLIFECGTYFHVAAPFTSSSERDRLVYFISLTLSTRTTMSVRRTPPGNKLIGESGSGGESTSNFSNNENEERHSTRNLRKRKERSHEYDFKKEFDDFKTQMMTFLEKFTSTQNENLIKIQQEIAEIKGDIKSIQSTTESLTQECIKIKNEIQSLQLENTVTQNKICRIENDLTELQKNPQPSGNLNSKSLFLCNENLMHEFNDRLQRQKNIVIVGIQEINETSFTTRNMHDEQAVLKTLKLLHETCPIPTKIFRLGKYNSEKSRPLKICFETTEIPKYLLKNKNKLPDNILIYSDRTPAQRNYLQCLNDEIKTREKNGESDLIIKYVKGKPEIVKNKSDPKN